MRRTPNYGTNYPQEKYKGDSQLLEEKNEDLTDLLKDKVKTLKSMTIEIGSEIRAQNEFLDDMDNTFSHSGGILERTMRRLGIVSKGSHNYHLLILFLFCFAVFFLLWIILKFR